MTGPTRATLLRLAAREARGATKRLVFLGLSLLLGVLAVVGIASLSDSIDFTIRSQAKELLTADLVVRGSRPLEAPIAASVREVDALGRGRTIETLSLASAVGASGAIGATSLVSVKGIEGGYPLYGGIELEPPSARERLESGPFVVVDRELIERIDVEVGDTLLLSGIELEIAGEILEQPDRLGASLSFAPEIVVSIPTLEATPLLALSQQGFYQTFLTFDPTDPSALEDAAETIRASVPPASNVRVETYREAQPQVRRALERLESYLGLLALLSLLIGGVGVLQGVRQWMDTRLDAIAVLKTMGLGARELYIVFSAQVLVTAFVASLAGAALGVLAQGLGPILTDGVIPQTAVSLWQPWALLRGLALGLLVAAIFSMEPLYRASRVSPARVLRRDVQPINATLRHRVGFGAVLALGGLLSAWIESGSVQLASIFVASVATALLLLLLVSKLLSLAAQRAPRPYGSVALRYGLSALGKAKPATLGAVVSLGLGLLVILAVVDLEHHLQAALRNGLSDEAPTTFFVNVDPSQEERLETILKERGATSVAVVPILDARIEAVGGRSADELVAENPDRRTQWTLKRDHQISFFETLPSYEEVVEGRGFLADDVAEISVDEGVAERLGITLGSSLTMSIGEREIEFTVTSLRDVDFDSFDFSFALIAEPAAVAELTYALVATARLPADGDGLVQQVATELPNVTTVELQDVLERIASILERFSGGLRFLALFTVGAAIVILAGALAMTADRRQGEVALLKVVGMRRTEVLRTLALEFALIGLSAALIGGVGGLALSWGVSTYALEIDWLPRPVLAAAAVLAGVVVATVTGLAMSTRALAGKPLQVLRREG